MGYTRADADADMHDIEMRDAEDQKVRAALEKARAKNDELRQEIETEKFRSVFGEQASQLSTGARLDFLGWLAPNLNAAEALNKSASRATICVALAGIPDYEIDDDRDEPQGLPCGIAMLDGIAPPATDSTWGSYGRPKRGLFHQITRMEGSDSKGRPINLITILYQPRVGNQPGQLVRGYSLTGVGICYAHLHGKGKVTKDDLYWYWLNRVKDGNQPQAPTNPAYLAMLGEGPPVDTSPHRWNTSAYPWGTIASLQREDTSVPERYKAISAQSLSTALVAVHVKDAVACLKFLDKDDQRALFRDVMQHSNVGTSKYAQSKIIQDLEGARTYAARIDLLAELYGSEHEAPPESKTVIEELICRCTWAVISRVMGHRTGEPEGRTVDAATELMTHARTFEQIEALQQMVGDMAATIGAQQSGYEGEWDTDDTHPGPARLG